MSIYSFMNKEKAVRQQVKEKQLALLVERTQSQLTGFQLAAQYWVIE